ncbi:MAG: glycosyltransferase family 4 protein [Candidatus Scalinduaceae bacterium]
MKFVIHTQYYPPETGAPQARLSEFAERLVQYGHEVTVVTAMPNYPLGRIYTGYGGLLKREVIKGVKVIRVWIYPTKSVSFIPRLSNYFSFVLSSLFLGAALLPRVDYILTESPPLFLGISGFILSRLKRAHWIFNVSDLWPETAVRLGVIGKGALLKVSERLEAFCYRKAWLVTGQSREILQGVKRRLSGVRTFHLSNGVDSSHFTPNLHSTTLQRELGEGATCVAIYAGLHGIAQGLAQILEAARILQNLDGKLKIVFIGDGAEKESLMQKAQGLQNVKFLPSRPREDIPKLLASADIALVPLKTYIPGAVPSKLYEAMASALPVVLVANGEAERIVNESGAGITVSPGIVNDLAQALRQMTLETDLRRKLGEQGRQSVLEKYDRGLIVDNFVNFLEEHFGNSKK